MNKDNSIQAVVFDLGNVIARVDFERPFAGMGCFLNAPLSPASQKELMAKVAGYERGEVKNHDFLVFMQDLARRENPLLPAGVPALETLRDIWNSMISGLPPENLQCIRRVKDHYTTCLLSNTNELHIDYVNRLQTSFEGGFESLFSKIYLSCRMGLSKPDPEIYRAMVRDLGIPAQRCLFIDDRVENIESARAQGLKGILLSGFDLPRLFTPEGVLSEYSRNITA
ncbi:MAG: HAD family phosphatase [Bacteroides sp.]|nr:HAD family phosphatase [Ruminococcus flavefaciens]MCM1554226.1 HAD family phosphatase [Bacteroides sp.]